MKYLQLLLRTFFQLLYHQFAWTYDLVAGTVSLGRWSSWINSTLPYLQGRILEIGYGPGQLQQTLHERGISSFGLDESRQMARQAARRLQKKGFQPWLARGLSQRLPFPGNSFDTVVATFPSEYIFDLKTLVDIRRLLRADGKLVVVPMAWITGKRPLERLAAWLFRVTGEAPDGPERISPAVRDRFTRAGLQVRSEIVDLPGSKVLIIVASR